MKKLMIGAATVAMLLCGSAMAADSGARLPSFNEMKVQAEKGNPVAQNNLAALYATGEGIGKDFKLAAEWYGKAAEQGYAIAQHNLGGMFETGQGVEKDPATAAVWYALAAEQGDGWAQVSLASLHAAGKLVQNDLSSAYRWSVVASANEDKDVRTTAADLIKQIGPKLSPAARAEAEKMAKVWRPNR
ncbi:MAG: sel1 repeat family protein [Rhodospirillaceae bacterium]|nr:sel1 repeat family protein [Rhodospirillales bacterium]